MLNSFTAKTIPKAAVLDNLLEEIEDLKDALDVIKRQKDPQRKLIPWAKIEEEVMQS